MLDSAIFLKLKVLWYALKRCFQICISVENVGLLFKAIGSIGKEITCLVEAGSSLYELYSLIKDKNLKCKQKIIPFLGSALAGIFKLVTLAILCTAALLLAPFLLVASVLNVFYNVGCYIRERMERSNLSAFFKDENTWYKEIEKCDLTPRLKMEFKKALHSEYLDKKTVYDLYVRLASHVVNQRTRDKDILIFLLDKLRKGEYLPHQEKKLKKEVKFYQRKLKKEFKSHYKPLFTLLKKKKRLDYLEKNVKNRIKQIGCSIGVMLISAAVCAVTIVAPPAAPIICAALGVLSAGLSTASGVLSTKLWFRAKREKKKVADPQHKITQAIVPQMCEKISIKEKKEKKLIFSSLATPPLAVAKGSPVCFEMGEVLREDVFHFSKCIMLF